LCQDRRLEFCFTCYLVKVILHTQLFIWLQKMALVYMATVYESIKIDFKL